MDTSLTVSLLLLALLGFWMIGAYNRLVGLRGGIVAAWKEFEAPLRRRHELLPPLLSGLRQGLPQEQPAIDAVLAASEQLAGAAEALRARSVDTAAAEHLRRVEQTLGAALTRLRALLEHHPEATEDESVGAALGELTTLDERLRFRRQLFNQAAQRYNVAIAQFPTSLLVPLFRFVPAGSL